MPSEPLTDAEIAELRALLPPIARGDTVTRSRREHDQSRALVLRLLDEVEWSREMADDVALLTLDYRDPRRISALERLKVRVRARL